MQIYRYPNVLQAMQENRILALQYHFWLLEFPRVNIGILQFDQDGHILHQDQMKGHFNIL